MIPHLQKRKKEGFSPGPFLKTISVVLVLIITGFLVFSNIKINQRKTEVQKQISSIQSEINDFQQKNGQLKLGISKGLDQDYVEKVAREDLGLQKEGESVVGFILPPSQNKTGSSQNFWQPGSIWQGIQNAWHWLVTKF